MDGVLTIFDVTVGRGSRLFLDGVPMGWILPEGLLRVVRCRSLPAGVLRELREAAEVGTFLIADLGFVVTCAYSCLTKATDRFLTDWGFIFSKSIIIII